MKLFTVSPVIYKTTNYEVAVMQDYDECGVSRAYYFLDLADENGSIKNLTSSTDKDEIITLASAMQGLDEKVAA